MRTGCFPTTQQIQEVTSYADQRDVKKLSSLMAKRRIEHEKLHGLHKEIEAKSSEAVQDDMFNYQCSLLDIGMIILNFYDAVSEGDGMRVVRCWKFMLPYLTNDGAHS